MPVQEWLRDEFALIGDCREPVLRGNAFATRWSRLPNLKYIIENRNAEQKLISSDFLNKTWGTHLKKNQYLQMSDMDRTRKDMVG